MPINTVFDPSNVNFFDKTKLNKDAQGLQMTVTAGTTGTIDLTLTMDIVVAGGSVLLAKGAAPGDYVEFQIVHPIYGVINQFITKWYVNPDVTAQQIPTSNYPAKIPAGLTMRVNYTSVGTSDVWIAINYNKEKVLE